MTEKGESTWSTLAIALNKIKRVWSAVLILITPTAFYIIINLQCLVIFGVIITIYKCKISDLFRFMQNLVVSTHFVQNIKLQSDLTLQQT